MSTSTMGAASTAPDPRAMLAAEWEDRAPSTPAEIAAFYRETPNYAADLAAWHATPERQSITDMLVHVARESGASCVVDIGCGAGHDLRALREALPTAALWGVEPNHALADSLADDGIYVYCGTHLAPIEDADLLVCIDVLEHVPDPEDYLAGIAQRAPIGCLLFEMTATDDTSTPLHLRENWGWHPGRCLERHGWEMIDRIERIHVWRRTELQGRDRASLLLCAYRSVSAETMGAIFALCAGNTIGWRQRTKTGDALIARSRAVIVTAWWRETNDDVFLMVDDDITFTPQDADRLAELCRNGHDIICGAYPVHDGGHLACRFFPGAGEVSFGPGQAPIQIEYAATGFMAVHRRVIDALAATLPLCHANESWGFFPLFQTRIVEDAATGIRAWLSEDWGFCALAREHGFRVWVDPQTQLRHLGGAAISVRNMKAMNRAMREV